MIKSVLKLLVIFSFLNTISAQNISVFAETDKPSYLIGDYISYKIEFRYGEGIQIIYPNIVDSIKNLDFINESAPETRKDKNETVEIRSYIFSKYDSASVTIPAFKIEYLTAGGEISTITVNPVQIRINTIEVDASGDIQDVKAPIKIQLDWWFIAIVALIIIAIIAAAYYIYKYYQKKKQPAASEKKAIKLPAHKLALIALAQLEEKKLWQQGKIKEYHSEITEIIRRYFEERFNFFAMEMTSGEILRKLKEVQNLDGIIEESENFFSNADLVKFAKFKPMPSVNEEMMKQALTIVNNTKPEDEGIKKIPGVEENV